MFLREEDLLENLHEIHPKERSYSWDNLRLVVMDDSINESGVNNDEHSVCNSPEVLRKRLISHFNNS